jgi:hypothetical protein
VKVDPVTHRSWLKPSLVFRAFKYGVYCLLLINLVLFFREDTLAAAETLGGEISWARLSEAYAATMDTLFWIVLLFLFELETAVIPDYKLQGRLKWVLMAVRSVSYFFISWALLGYIEKWLTVSALEPFLVANVCDLVGTGVTWIEDLDHYFPLDAAACAALQGADLVRIQGTSIIGSLDAALAAAHLAVVDIVNAADWLLIVVLLEVEVTLQLRNRLTPRLIRVFKWLKGVLYATLFAAAVYWGFLGDFLDFWDAFLWLVAFIFIEMNIFTWHSEVEEEKAHGHSLQPG